MRKISDAAREMLTGNIIPFWLRLKDEENGGFYGLMDADLTLHKEAEKGCILNSRILWFFSECAMEFGGEELKEAARHAYRFLRERFLDPVYGGVYWSVDAEGAKLDTAKHTYCQAFAIYGLAAYYRMSDDRDALQTALDLFRLIEDHSFDGEGYLESFKEDWRPESNEKLSENGVVAERTMNTLLHIFEAYAGLYQAEKNPEVAAAMKRILAIYAEQIFDPERNSLKVFCDRNYRSLLDLYSYGHDIEASWLVDQSAALLQNEITVSEIYQINTKLAENAIQNGMTNGCMATERENGKLYPWQVWWVQAESVTGFLNQWEKHPDESKYALAARDIFHYIEDAIIDKRPGGEWFWQLDEKGDPDPKKPIVEPWKCPYHNGRMCLEIIRRDPELYV